MVSSKNGASREIKFLKQSGNSICQNTSIFGAINSFVSCKMNKLGFNEYPGRVPTKEIQF